MSVLVYKDAATLTAFVSQMPVVPACDDNPLSVAIAATWIDNGDGTGYYDFTAPINPDVVSSCVGADGRRAQAYPFSPLQEAAIQAEINWQVSQSIITSGSVTLTSGASAGLPGDWQFPTGP